MTPSPRRAPCWALAPLIVKDDSRSMVESLLQSLSYFYIARVLWPMHAMPRRHGLDVARH